ncbi:MAG: branched-chain amino acid aminotransferase [Bacillota bacterium]|nr:branched-chain amino acid aminotransferase [Bacillota bacterium]
MQKKDIDWSELGFSYIKTDKRYISYWRNGRWDDGQLVEDNKITISEGSTCLHYAQECFEGLKAYSTQDGGIQLFRPDENAKRMQRGCEKLLMPTVATEKFIEACAQVVRANEAWIPPYGSGATLYLRPYIIGIGDNIGSKPASEYIFSIFVLPVGSGYKDKLRPVNYIVTEQDRAAAHGTGAIKVGGNYAASLQANAEAASRGFAGCLFLDPVTHTKIDEAGGANFFGVTKDNKFVTPYSPSILPGITKMSLMQVARDYCAMEALETDIYIDKIDQLAEAGICGTAKLATPIGRLEYRGNPHVFYSETEAGPVITKLYDTLFGIQTGDIEAPAGWIYKI